MFRRRRRERREWTGAGAITPTTVAVGALSASNLLSSATMEEFPGARTGLLRGSIFISPATAPAAATGYGVILGIARVAQAGGTNAQPDPEVNLDYNWLWWEVCFPQIGGTAAADSNAARWIGYFRFDPLIRTRLRWHDFDSLFLFVKNSASSGASIQFSHLWRVQILAGAK